MAGNKATLCWSATLHNGGSEYEQVRPFIYSLSPPLVLQLAWNNSLNQNRSRIKISKANILSIIPEFQNITIFVVNLAAQNFHAPYRPLLTRQIPAQSCEIL
jgi:hypothetical protein